jgi:hypothetical protein
MFDRYDPRHDNHRDRGDSQERNWGSRGGGEQAGVRDDEGGVFGRHVDLPRGSEREIVRERKRSYELNGWEGEALATVAAFRVVQVSDVQDMLAEDQGDRSAQKSLEHLQASGLLERIPLERRDDDVLCSRTEVETSSRRIGVSTPESCGRRSTLVSGSRAN